MRFSAPLILKLHQTHSNNHRGLKLLVEGITNPMCRHFAWSESRLPCRKPGNARISQFRESKRGIMSIRDPLNNSLTLRSKVKLLSELSLIYRVLLIGATERHKASSSAYKALSQFESRSWSFDESTESWTKWYILSH
jgi:hypothetical protein